MHLVYYSHADSYLVLLQRGSENPEVTFAPLKTKIYQKCECVCVCVCVCVWVGGGGG